MPKAGVFFKIFKMVLAALGKVIAFIIYYIFEFAFAPLIIFGSMLCIMYIEPWPMKFVGIITWLVFLYVLYKVIDKFTGSGKRDN